MTKKVKYIQRVKNNPPKDVSLDDIQYWPIAKLAYYAEKADPTNECRTRCEDAPCCGCCN